jgi:hypothetical protein
LAEGKLMISIITEEIHTNYEVIISDTTTIGDILSEIGTFYFSEMHIITILLKDELVLLIHLLILMILMIWLHVF